MESKRSGGLTSLSVEEVLAHSSNVFSRRSILRSASESTVRSPPEDSISPSRTVAARPIEEIRETIRNAATNAMSEIDHEQAPRGWRPSA